MAKQRQEWEYLVHDVVEAEMQAALTELGIDYWELVSSSNIIKYTDDVPTGAITLNIPANFVRLYLKRPKE